MTYAVHLMTPYLTFEGIRAKDEAEAVAICQRDAYPDELDGNTPTAWVAAEEGPEGDDPSYPHDEEDGISGDHLDLGAFESRNSEPDPPEGKP
jgi:hypothetical protein